MSALLPPGLAVIGYVVFGFDAEAAAAAGHVIGPVPVFGAAPAVPAALAECEAFAAAFGGTVAPVVQSDCSAEFDPASEEVPA